MSEVNENSSSMGAFQHRDNMRGLPFRGGNGGDFNFVMGRSQFTPGISIKLLPLSDMSKKGTDIGISEFENNANVIKQFFKPGDRVRGILVNSQLKSENGKTVLGKLQKVDINRRNHSIKIYIKNPETLKTQEIYVDSMERIFESKYLAKGFSEFLGS